MTKWMRTAVAAVVAAGGLSGVGCTGTGSKSATADPVARGAYPDGGCPAQGGCPTCPGGAAGCATGGGCGAGSDRIGLDDRLANLYDPCYPQRYNYTARREVLAPFAIQVHNSEIIEQTVWNYHFVPETDTLNPAGLQKLDTIVRRRPTPDAQVYIQTARDLTYDPAKPDKFVADRIALNEKRAQAVQRYLNVQTASRPVNFSVTTIDPADPAIPAIFPANSVRGMVGLYRSGITGAGGMGTQAQGAGGGAVSAAPTTGGAPGTGR